MPHRLCTILAALLIFAVSAAASMEAKPPVLRAYGPGGPHLAITECAKLFEERHGIKVGVVKASPQELAVKLREEGDIYFTGAEYMVDEFVAENPGIIDMDTLEKLHPRRLGILVRKGNPLGIMGLGCLTEEGVDVLTAHLENIQPLLALDENGYSTATVEVYTGSEGVKAWRNSPNIDAWVTYKSWHQVLKDETDFIEISCGHALRHTMIALTARTPHREHAGKFIDFLQGLEAREIFRKHGWE